MQLAPCPSYCYSDGILAHDRPINCSRLLTPDDNSSQDNNIDVIDPLPYVAIAMLSLAVVGLLGLLWWCKHRRCGEEDDSASTESYDWR